MIIDCHTHINNYHNEEVESLQKCLDDLLREMRKNRVDVALVLTSYKINPGRPSTRDAVLATRDLNNVFIVAGISYVNYDERNVNELREFLQDGSVRGLKLYPGYEPFFPNDPKLYRVFELAEEFGVPVMVHSGDTYDPKGRLKYAHPLHIDDVAVDHPNVNIVICHIGNPWIRDCMEVVYKNKNVYTDISGLVLGDFNDRFESYMHKQLQEMLVYGVEPDKVLFGTDWPISSMESYLQFMEELKIPPKDKKKIMYENAAKLFKLPVNGGGYGGGSLLDWLK
jgi:predicted TIM-barrel fold metal-dependent hydrolase